MIKAFLKEKNLFEVDFRDLDTFISFIIEKIITYCDNKDCKEQIIELFNKKLNIFPSIFGKYYIIIHIYNKNIQKTQILLFKNKQLLLFKKHKYLTNNYINLFFVIISNDKNSQHYMKLKGRIIRVLETFNQEINNDLDKVNLIQFRNKLGEYEKQILNVNY